MEYGLNGLLGLPVTLPVSITDKDHVTVQARPMVANTVLGLTVTHKTAQLDYAKVNLYEQGQAK